MKIFLLICLATGLASTEKLDRTYLPPPGSKFSGGSPGDIQVPLEYPKETYLTGQSDQSQPEGIPEIELGINRHPKPVNGQGSTQRPGFTNFRNNYPVPQTTTSFAITQTTTFAPPEDYEGLAQSSGFLNTTSVEHAGLPKYPQGLVYQNQPNQGRPGIPPAYNQYQPGQNQQGQMQQSTLAPYGTTQRPFFESNRKPEPYLPPVPFKGQTTSGQNVFAQNNGGYLSGQPQGPTYQDGQQYSTTYRPLVNQPEISLSPVDQQNQFNDNVNKPSSTAAPKYQGQRFGPTNTPNENQQRLGSMVQQQNLNQFPGSQNFVTSTVGPQYQNGQRITNPGSNLHNQYISSTTPPQYQYGQRIVIPGTGQQQYQLDQNAYPISQNFPSSTATPQYQNGQQFTSPGSVFQSQHSPSTTAPQYQGSQQFVKPGIPQGETLNQGVFGSRVPIQQNQKYPVSENFPSSTAAPQFQNRQQFHVTTGSDQPVQFLETQNIPSTASPQYQDGQHVFRPGTTQDVFSPNQRVIGAQVPSQQNQNQYVGNQLFPSTTAAPQFTDSVQFTTPGSTLNQYQSEEQQNFPSSTAAPQYQFTSPGLDQQNQYIGSPNIPTDGSQFQNGQLFRTSQGQAEYSRLPNQGSGIRENQQFPSTAAPQYQSILSPTPGSNQQGLINVNQYPAQPNYNQRFPSSTVAPQKFVTKTSPQYGNQAIQTGPQGTTLTSDYNQDTQPIFGSFPTRNYEAPGVVSQGRPERPQAASDRTAEILSYGTVLTPEGYSYSYDTSNGIHADETGTVGNGTRAKGGYSYTGDDGKIYSVFYSADENGFQPRGDHLPTPPPIPEAIKRVIEQANKDKASGISDDGSYNEEKYGHKKYNGTPNQVRPENKNVTPISGVDIANRYENRIGTQNKKKIMNTEDKQAYRDDEIEDDVQDQVDYKNLDDVEDDVKDEEATNQRTPNKRPTKVKNLTVEDNRRNYNNENYYNRHPATEKEQVVDVIDNVSISEETDLDESQNEDEESDLVNYKDDLNFRTDFHGMNKYLPKSKGDRQRPMMSLDNKKTTSKGIGKHRRPTNRKPEISQNVAFENEQDFRDDDRVRKPSIKNKISQKVDQTKFDQPSTLVNDDDYKSFSNSNLEDNAFDEKMKSTKGAKKPERNLLGMKRISKPLKSRNGGYETVSDNEKVDVVKDEGKGYLYTQPQKNFQSGQAIEFSTRTSVTERPKLSQKESPTTLRPFMTPNVYGDDNGEITDDYMAGIVHGKPMSPSTSRKHIYPGSGKDSQKYNYDVTPGKTEGERFGEDTQITEERRTMPSVLPSGRYQSTSRPQYEGQDAVTQNEYNKPTKSQSFRRPGNKIIYNNNAPNEGVFTVNKGFVSTTPLPPSVSTKRPGQYKPTDYNSRIINAQGEDISRPGGYDISGNQNTQGLVPSTTYRPNYVFGDKTLAPKGSVPVDEFGRPILGTTGPEINELSNLPGRVDETFIPTEGRFGVTGPTQGTPGVYHGSTSAPGEDFIGPKQPQRYDSETGYYYK